MDSLGKYLVSRAKRKDTTLYQEIDVLSRIVDPMHIVDREERVEYWIYEIPEFQVSLDWDVPAWVFKIMIPISV